jgi:hypothetical protein
LRISSLTPFIFFRNLRKAIIFPPNTNSYQYLPNDSLAARLSPSLFFISSHTCPCGLLFCLRISSLIRY